MQALSKNPDDRFPDSMAFADKLSKWLGDKPAAAAKKLEEKQRKIPPIVWIPAAIIPVVILILVIVSQINRGTTPSESRWDHATNLLALADPAKDSVAGSWTAEKGSLVSAASSHARIEIPWRPSQEYDLLVTFVRRDGGDDVAVLLPWKGGSFVWTARTLENGEGHTAVFHVRNDGLSSNFYGRLVNSQNTYATRGPNDPKWALRDTALIGLGSCDGVVEFQRAEILEGGVKGSRIRP
jgi:hypothetical protein